AAGSTADADGGPQPEGSLAATGDSVPLTLIGSALAAMIIGALGFFGARRRNRIGESSKA
ncbi:LPXTG cell wall anchor domain-containing protein, partial [Microbacterium sp. NPDC089695]|uniref:LPXTG cell wall anchor domain-containing protein n=1 Tax=Microbacterium sp. NPDC089695 TaxID=3364198 RepID=UPI0038043024